MPPLAPPPPTSAPPTLHIDTADEQYFNPNRSLTTSYHHQQLSSSRNQLLYPPGSTDSIVSEKTAIQRSHNERVVYENSPVSPTTVAANTAQLLYSPNSRLSSPRSPIATTIDNNQTSRIVSTSMSNSQPKSILKSAPLQSVLSSSSSYGRSETITTAPGTIADSNRHWTPPAGDEYTVNEVCMLFW